MTSKISFFSTMKEDLRRRGWMLGFSFLLSFLAMPIAFLAVLEERYITLDNYLDYFGNGKLETYPDFLFQNCLNIFNDTILFSEGIVLTVAAIAIGILGFRYLFTRNSSDLYHSLPASRSRLFFSGYINGLIIWFLPYLVNLLLTVIIFFFRVPSTYWGMILFTALKCTFYFLMAFLLIYHISLIGVMISGSTLSAFTSSLLLGTGIVYIYYMIRAFCQEYLETYLSSTVYFNPIFTLSPVCYAWTILNKGMGSSTMTIKLILLSFVLLGITFLIPWKLYQKRPSELAEQGIHNKWMIRILKCMGAFALGITCTLLFTYVLFNRFLGWYIFGGLLGVILTYGILNTIFNRSVKRFFSEKILLAVMSVFTVFFSLAIYFDWIGYSTYIPKRESMVSASVALGGYREYGGSMYFRYSYPNQGQKKQDMKYTDMDELYHFLTEYVNQETKSFQGYSTGFEVSIKLKSGRTFSRYYYINERDKELLRSIIESDEYREYHYPHSSGLEPYPDSINISSDLDSITYNVTDKGLIADIMDSYTQDFCNSYTLENIGSGIMLVNLEIEYNNLYRNLSIYEDYENTLQTIKSIYPALALSPKDTTITTIHLQAPIDTENPSENLYHYFQHSGYNDFEIARDIYYPYSMSETTLLITDENEINQLVDVFHIGNLYSQTLSDKNYIRVGYAKTSSGASVDCYVEPGAFPAEYIERMLEQ